ncbi:MAG TPA: endopeptidase La [Spirochaetia bacterium]|nr:endopeptidase La [Spirochaetia bacterium]
MKDYRSAERRAPILAVSGQILFPEVTSMVRIRKDVAEPVLASAPAHGDRVVVLLADSEGKPHGIGTLAEVEGSRVGTLGLDITLRGLARVRVERIAAGPSGPLVDYEFDDDAQDLDEGTAQVLLQNIKGVSRDILGMIDGGENILKLIEGQDDVVRLMAFVIQNSPIPAEDKYGFLTTSSLKARGLKVLDHLSRQKESLRLQVEMNTKISEQAGKSHRENILREQLKNIKEELGEGKPKASNDYRDRVEKAPLPEAVKTAALEEVEKLEQMGGSNPEANVVRNYLDLILSLPWAEPEAKAVDLVEARKVLDADHYGLEKVKDLIIQHLAVLQLKKDKKGTVLLLVGPPGVGKTSLGQSIAKAMGREFIRASLGGVRDDAEIRGHRRTYLGALPGRILQAMKRAGAKNPVFLLDEVDKLTKGWGGDPASALLEVLDPEQNNSFQDHYLDLPYDLSQVFFIATANSTESIPGPLLDRMEVISLSGYTEAEKVHIAQDYLVPKQLELHGLTGKLEIPAEVIRQLAGEFTREAGVRDLQRKIQMLCRVSSEAILKATDAELPIRVDPATLEDRIGAKPFRHEAALADQPPGVATGLAWTPVGGDILFLETAAMPGSGQLILTGQLGDVMKESARIALSLVRSQLGVLASGFDFKSTDIHLHVPSGSIPKDGPSAGTAMFTTLASLVLGRKVDSKLAMTGEVTLRGAVMPVGGIKEKLIAAHRAGIRRILLPRFNEKDLKELPAEVRSDLDITLVDHVAEVLRLVFGIAGAQTPGAGPGSDPRDRASLA